MNKKFHAGLLSVLVCAAIGSVASCTKDYGEDIAQLQSEVSTLQSTVNSLQSQITAGSVITAVASTSNGVTVTLSNGKTFTLTNGKDGANGTNGKDGVNGTNGKDGKDGIVYTIGEDGYWYKDGVKTEYKAVGKDGKDGKDGVNGTNGKDGVDGKDGKDGVDGKDGKDGVDGKDGKDGVDGKDGDTIYYYPNCEKNLWVKVTNGVETETTDQVYVPGTVTAVWDPKDGTLTLNNVEGSEEPIVITLAQELKSLAFIPEIIFEGVGVIEFTSLSTPAGEFITSSPATATYRLNPAAVDASAYQWGMINRLAYVAHDNQLTRAAGDSTDLVEIVGKPVVADGAATFNLKLLKNLTVAQELGGLTPGKNLYIVALQATTPAGELITSDYAYINKNDVHSFELIHKDTIKFEGETIVKSFPYRAAPIAISEVADSALYEADGVKTPVLVYNQTLDLKEYVETMAGSKLLSSYGVEPVYTWFWANEKGAAKTAGTKVAYLGDDKYTDQNAFVTMTEDGVIAVDNEFVKNGRAAINRTPQVCVKATVNGKLVDSAFIKIAIVDTTFVPVVGPTPQAKGWKILIQHSVPFCYDSLSATPKAACPDYTADSLVVTWPEFNQMVLDNDDINMSLEQFRENYDIENLKIYEEVVKDAKKGTLDTVLVENNTLATGVDYTWNLPQVVTTTTDILRETLINTVDTNSTKKYFYVYPAIDTVKNFDVVIEMTYTVDEHNHVWKPATFELTLNHDYILGTQNKTVDSTKVAGAHPEHNTPLAGAVRIKGKSIDGKYEPVSSIIEHFENYEFEVPAGSTYTFEIVRAADKKNFKLVGEGATTDSTAVIAAGKYNANKDPQVDIKYVATEPLTDNVDVLVKVTETVAACGCTRATYYFVEFGAQFQVELADVVLRTYKAQADSVLVDTLITVTDGTNVVFETVVAEDGTYSFKATQYGIDTYGFADGQLVIESYKIIFDKSGADAESTFGGCLNKIDTDLIVWDNMGTDLQNNKYAKLGVTVKIGDYYKAATESGKITVLSTENSK